MHASLTLFAAFAFTVPDGWVDHSKDPPQAIEALTSVKPNDKAQVSAVATDEVDGVVRATMTAVLFDWGEAPTTASVRDFASGLEASVRRQKQVRILGSEAVKLGEVDARLLTFEFDRQGKRMRSRNYLVPGEAGVALLSFACGVEEVERYLPVFDAAFQATTGAVQPKPPQAGAAHKPEPSLWERAAKLAPFVMIGFIFFMLRGRQRG